MVGVRCPCPKKLVGCNWGSPNDDKITTVGETMNRAWEHFGVCPTNLRVIQEAQERKERGSRRWTQPTMSGRSRRPGS